MIASLPRREREIFEILCSAGEATAADVRRAMADPPSHSAVRTMLARLEAKGLVCPYRSLSTRERLMKLNLMKDRPEAARAARVLVSAHDKSS